MAALTGCVSVDAPAAPAPAPAAEPARPGREVAPQIVDGPAREALEAALPAPPPLAEESRPDAVPRQREHPRASPRPDPYGPAVPSGR
ncbi:hypothetical protein [Streptomyces sp. NPDC088757]|uniref:hypothetical protein n=1 Tax=Streptomyces sp. NPDC088757 TaxID=3365889 RepID=UPI0037F8DFF5